MTEWKEHEMEMDNGANKEGKDGGMKIIYGLEREFTPLGAEGL